MQKPHSVPKWSHPVKRILSWKELSAVFHEPRKMPSNNRNRNQTRRINGRRNKQSPKTPLSLFRTKLNGRNVNPAADPRSIVTNPWNTLTILAESDVGGTFVFSDLVTLFEDQIGTTDSTPVEFRVLEARAWELSGNNIRGDFYPFLLPFQQTQEGASTSNAAAPLSIQADDPGRNRWSKIGYVWPSPHQSTTFRPVTGYNAKILSLYSAASTPNIVLHVKILWRILNINVDPSKKSFEKSVWKPRYFQHSAGSSNSVTSLDSSQRTLANDLISLLEKFTFDKSHPLESEEE